MTIVEFIEARLADWENLAKSATELPQVTVKYPEKRPPWEPERWAVDHFWDVVTVNGAADPIQFDPGGGGVRSGHVSALMAEFDPAMVLTIASGLRGMVDDAIWNISNLDGEFGDGCGEGDIRAGKCKYPSSHPDQSPSLRALATFWAAHTDYQPEWAA
ncbi:DUF6221 family protein [Nocardia sp. NPDC057455]|uniref:DUF6221 family protein n=1 Tax=Nocardia sp. NPDC057455 TaxID=3346138 RepID=UPI00366FE518